jgi:caffeoyl-CoA O-methyltransferase
MSLYLDELDEYLEKYSSPQARILDEIERWTHVNTLQANMISGKNQGHFLSIITSIINPKTVLEIGTFTGFSAMAMGLSLSENAVLYTIENDIEKEKIIQTFIEKEKLSHKIILKMGNALEVLDSIEGRFDLVFIDADKEYYSNYYDKIISRMNTNGIILVDNVLWKGKVLDPNTSDKKAQILHNFNEKMAADPRVQMTILPIRDGVSFIRVK